MFFFNVVRHYQLLSVMLMKYGQNVHKHNISQIKLFWGKMCGVYVTYVADVDKDNDMKEH